MYDFNFLKKNKILKLVIGSLVYSFTDLVDNVGQIIQKDHRFKKFISFLIILPIIYILIKIQIAVGLLFLFYYFFYFFIIFFLKTNWVMSCLEIPLNTSHLIKYSIYNLIIGIPRAKAFIIIYNFLYAVLKKQFFKKLSLKEFLTIILFFILIFLMRFSLILIFGISYLTLYLTIKFINDVFYLLTWNYESKKALFQTIVLNCFVVNSDSIAKAHESKIIVNDSVVEFNMKKLFKAFFENVKDEYLLFESYKSSNIKISKTGEPGHYTYTDVSLKYKNENISTNWTSKENLTIYKEIIDIKNDRNVFKKEIIKLESKDISNLKNENNYNYLVNPYKLDNNSIKKEVEPKLIEAVNSKKGKVIAFFLDSKDKKIMEYSDSKLLSKENAPNLKEYSQDYHLSIGKKIKLQEEFEKKNEKYLNSKGGKETYDIVKRYLSTHKLYDSDDD